MSTIKARAIVIKEKAVGESNKQLTLLAKDQGKIIASARGARNLKSKFLACAQPFCYCDFMLYEGRGFLAVTEGDLITNFSVYLNDIYKLTYGSYFLELMDKSVMASQEANDILLLLLKSLQALKNTNEPKKISSVFGLRLLDLLGFRPDFNSCALCGAKVSLVFSEMEGLLCQSCIKSGGALISDNTKKAADYILNSESNGKAFMFTLPKASLEELNAITEALIKIQLEFEACSLSLLR